MEGQLYHGDGYRLQYGDASDASLYAAIQIVTLRYQPPRAIGLFRSKEDKTCNPVNPQRPERSKRGRRKARVGNTGSDVVLSVRQIPRL